MARFPRLTFSTLFTVLLLVVVAGCEDLRGCANPAQRPDLAGYGEACESQEDCLGGLACAADNVCRYEGEPGTFAEGDECVSTTFCQLGLVCSAMGQCARPGAPGTAGVGETCDAREDCQLGLDCLDGTCRGFHLPIWTGVECDTADDPGPFRVLFEVPKAEPRTEFYRFPFPNDGYIQGGTVDLSDHPTPGALIPEIGDVVGEIIDGLEADFDGFGNNQAVLMRLSGRLDFDTIELGLPSAGGTAGVVDLTEGERYGRQAYGRLRYDGGRGQYICANSIAMTPHPTNSYRPGHTYLAYLTTDLRSDGGQAIARDSEFDTIMGDSEPPDPYLARVWRAYAPARQWVAETGADLAGAAVFTVKDPIEPLELLHDAVQAAPAPVASDLHLCGADPGPFADDDDAGRGCSGADPAHHEVQGRVTLPQFQAGTPPFKDASDGGAIPFDGGQPPVAYTESAVFSLTVPTGAIPANGWPLVVFGHGTKGDYRSFVRNGLAEELSAVALDDGTTVGFAVLSVDAVHHGARRHPENWKDSWLELDPGAYDADVLYYNPINPWAARDNALQAAADNWSLVRLAAALSWTDGESPTGQAVRFDPANLFYAGHSQGSTNGAATLAYEPAFRAGALSAGGGLFIDSLLYKTKPNDIPSAIRVGIADPRIDRFHPLLNIAQAAAERADGLNHARLILRDPPAGRRHVFQTFGIGDNYTPDSTQEALVFGLGLEQVTNGNAPIRSVSTETAPVSGNVAGATGIVALYQAPGANDAHFVLFDRDDAMRQFTHFLATAVRDGTPTVVAP